MSDRKRLTQSQKLELEELYETFFKLYDESLHHFGSTLMFRINSRFYRKTEMNRLIEAIKWFNQFYGEGYYMKVEYTPSMWIRVYDSETDINFVVYLFNKDKKLHEKTYSAKLDMERTSNYIEYLKRDNEYNEEKFIIYSEHILPSNEKHPIIRF